MGALIRLAIAATLAAIGVLIDLGRGLFGG